MVRDDVGALLLGKRNVAVGREVLHCWLVGLDLDALVFCFSIIKAVEHEGLAKLAVIEEVSGELLVAVDPDLEAGENSLHDPDVEIVPALGQHGTARWLYYGD